MALLRLLDSRLPQGNVSPGHSREQGFFLVLEISLCFFYELHSTGMMTKVTVPVPPARSWAYRDDDAVPLF